MDVILKFHINILFFFFILFYLFSIYYFSISNFPLSVKVKIQGIVLLALKRVRNIPVLIKSLEKKNCLVNFFQSWLRVNSY